MIIYVTIHFNIPKGTSDNVYRSDNDYDKSNNEEADATNDNSSYSNLSNFNSDRNYSQNYNNEENLEKNRNNISKDGGMDGEGDGEKIINKSIKPKRFLKYKKVQKIKLMNSTSMNEFSCNQFEKTDYLTFRRVFWNSESSNNENKNTKKSYFKNKNEYITTKLNLKKDYESYQEDTYFEYDLPRFQLDRTLCEETRNSFLSNEETKVDNENKIINIFQINKDKAINKNNDKNYFSNKNDINEKDDKIKIKSVQVVTVFKKDSGTIHFNLTRNSKNNIQENESRILNNKNKNGNHLKQIYNNNFTLANFNEEKINNEKNKNRNIKNAVSTFKTLSPEGIKKLKVNIDRRQASLLEWLDQAEITEEMVSTETTQQLSGPSSFSVFSSSPILPPSSLSSPLLSSYLSPQSSSSSSYPHINLTIEEKKELLEVKIKFFIL